MGQQSEDLYALLGVQPQATVAEIKSAFRELALRLHPDNNDSPDAHAEFLAIHEAYRVLINPVARQRYDAAHRLKPSNPAGRMAGIEYSREITRQKRASRYQRSQYSRRFYYRASTAPPRTQEEGGGAPMSDSFAASIIAEHAAAEAGYKWYNRFLDVVLGCLLAVCLLMIVDRLLTDRTAPEVIQGQVPQPWSLDMPGYVRIVLPEDGFMVHRSETDRLAPGMRVSPQRTLIARRITGVWVGYSGSRTFIAARGGIYGDFYFLVWIVAGLSLFALCIRQYPEQQAYLGTATILVALVAAGILLRS
ncbi:MAG: J domain-containing protein [Bacteroidia bacterium]|nr:J domain-containing protein [Bacteroidia bacterium]